MNKSILGMNRTIGERELEQTGILSPLERIQVKIDLANTLDREGQDAFNREVGRGMRKDALAELIDFANDDPEHIAFANPAPLFQRDLDEWQEEVRATRESERPL